MTSINTIYERAYLVDTGSLIAFYNRKDQRNIQVTHFLFNTIEKHIPIVITQMIIAETYRRLLYDINQDTALLFMNDLVSKFICNNIEQKDIENALQIITKYNDHELTLTDAVSLAVMKRLKIYKAIAFDYHFTLLGFYIEP